MNRIILKIGMGLLILLYSISIIISIFNVSKENYEKEYIKLLDKDSIEGKKFYLDSYGKWLDDCWRT